MSQSEAEVAAAMSQAYDDRRAYEADSAAGGPRVYDPADEVPSMFPPLPVTVVSPDGEPLVADAEGEDVNDQ